MVVSEHADGIAYLLEWQELQPGEWSAEISYLAWDPKGAAWVEQRAMVTEDDLTRIEGQNYLSVPRWKYSEVHRRRREREGR